MTSTVPSSASADEDAEGRSGGWASRSTSSFRATIWSRASRRVRGSRSFCVASWLTWAQRGAGPRPSRARLWLAAHLGVAQLAIAAVIAAPRVAGDHRPARTPRSITDLARSDVDARPSRCRLDRAICRGDVGRRTGWQQASRAPDAARRPPGRSPCLRDGSAARAGAGRSRAGTSRRTPADLLLGDGPLAEVLGERPRPPRPARRPRRRHGCVPAGRRRRSGGRDAVARAAGW